jgi:hypothetical protein
VSDACGRRHRGIVSLCRIATRDEHVIVGAAHTVKEGSAGRVDENHVSAPRRAPNLV